LAANGLPMPGPWEIIFSEEACRQSFVRLDSWVHAPPGDQSMSMHDGRWTGVCRLATAVVLACLLTGAAQAQQRGGRRGPSPQQIRQMQQEMQYRQQEMIRVQQEAAAKERELMAKFDENGDGKLFGKEKFKYESHLRDIRFGRAPNPFADIKPVGQGPKPKK
jgi:hypothetical protein